MTESFDGVNFIRGRLLDSGDRGCKVLGGSNDSVGACDDRYGYGAVLETKCVGEMLATYSFHDGMDAVELFQ